MITTDIIFFGKDFTETRVENQRKQSCFIKSIREKFSGINVFDAYDFIKGFHTGVDVPEEILNEYAAFLIGCGYSDNSRIMQALTRLPEKQEQLNEIAKLAVKLYSDSVYEKLKLKSVI